MADETLIKQITVNGVGHKVDYESLANLPVIPTAYDDTDLKARCAELEADNENKAKIIKKLQKTADRVASIAYADLPKLTYTLGGNITEFYVVRGNDGKIDNPIWTKDNTTYSYHKNGQGYEEAGDDAQFNFVAVIPEGKAIVLKPTYEGETQPYKNLTGTVPYKDESGAEVANTYRISATKVTGSFDLAIDALASYSVSYVNGSYTFSTDEKEVPASIAEGQDLVFKFYHEIDKSVAPTVEPTAAETLAKIDSIKVDDVALVLTEDMVTTTAGKKKATITIPAASITGAVVVTLKTVVTE